ncbi:F-box/LRR-repeat protein [Hibiscus syriacus]|uniref:F-box/LRR-repeat protein n=1 Tax=Hibiscus syriacus TaxID=106335 RepID=A0A6A3BCI5_HIBSY|nr:F-box/LRR-repeat protein [Hibiscus syriacus]
MFDLLLKPKFYSKCKSALRINKVRLETIKKKRNAVENFLKKDIADLLKNDLDYNAYGRAEGLTIEQNQTACYKFIEQFSLCISMHVSIMQKQSECPEECREAIASLIYAAARFADLPELRTLRALFTKKYGNSLEPYLNREFVEKLQAEPPTKEMKLQLMHAIAREFSIEWDSKALEQTLFKPPPSEQYKALHKSWARMKQ